MNPCYWNEEVIEQVPDSELPLVIDEITKWIQDSRDNYVLPDSINQEDFSDTNSWTSNEIDMEVSDFEATSDDDNESSSSEATQLGDFSDDIATKIHAIYQEESNRPASESPVAFQCLLCSFKARTNFGVRMHIKKDHLVEEEPKCKSPPITFPCPVCPFQGRLNIELNRHKQKDHSNIFTFF